MKYKYINIQTKKKKKSFKNLDEREGCKYPINPLHLDRMDVNIQSILSTLTEWM